MDSTDGGIRGTGFFVAPGWVLTCAHVVEGAERVAVVTAAGGEPLPGEVAARSADRVPGPSVFWPFPDLALIRTDVADHRCVWLDARGPLGDECHAWGYPQREDGVAPTGSPASFRSEGVEGDDYLKLKAGQAAPGLSGAPLLCPGRRAVVGVMTMTRDKRDDLGGWASPVSALLTGGPGVPDDLLALGSEIMRANRAAVLQDRGAWHRVLPMDGSDGALRQPWGTFRKTRRPDPADLLLAEFGVVPYLFRDTDIARAIEWCESDEALAVSVAPGRGGAGKTRFAVELCQRMAQDHGWVSGMWDERYVEAADVVALPLPRLLVVDYVESEDLASLGSLLDRLRGQATDIAPVRVLLLTRAGVTGARDPIRTLREGATSLVKLILDDRDIVTAASAPLDDDERDALYASAVDAFADAWEVSPTRTQPDLSAPGYGVPLEVLFEALDQTLDGGGGGSMPPGPSPDGPFVPLVRSPVERVLLHEEKYWAGDCPIDDGELRRACVALATLAGAADDREAEQLLALLLPLYGDSVAGLRRRVIEWLASLYGGGGRLNPLRPDRLGEALVGTVLRAANDPSALLDAILSLESDDQVAQTLEVLARLVVNDQLAADAMAGAIARQHGTLLERAQAQARGGPRQPGRLRLVGALIRIHTGRLTERVELAVPAEQIRALGITYDTLAGVAVTVGQSAEARLLYNQSISIDRRLADTEPGNTLYQRDLSVSYERLGALAEEAQEAVDWLTKAAARRRALHEQEAQRIDLAEELAVCLYLLADVDRGRLADIEHQIIDLLHPFESAGTISVRGTAILGWARE